MILDQVVSGKPCRHPSAAASRFTRLTLLYIIGRQRNLWENVFGSLHAPRLQFTIEEAVNIAGTLVVEAGGIALQTLVGVGVDDCGESRR